MCGIAGFIDYQSSTNNEVLRKMADAIIHRGPDDSGYEIFSSDKYSVGFGFRRLSIIELTELGHQPMFSDSGKQAIIFNGEIYNYREIRKELESMGQKFHSNSDTEVILKSYLQWGMEFVQRLIGMFAIALYDHEKRKLYLIRDRAGVKPLYYYSTDKTFLFASELKAFHQHPVFKKEKEIDLDALGLYFQHGYIPAPYSIFKNTYKLLQGHYAEIDLATRGFEIKKYWDVNDYYNLPKLDISFEEAKQETEKILISAFNYRMVADVPVGVFLSGGYDSSTVAALLQKNSSQKIKTFTIGFHEQEFNEAQYAHKVAEHLGTEHYEHYCTFKEAMDIVPLLPEVYDEPFGDSSAIPTILVSGIARQHVKVALSADGGDEIFAGYLKYIKAKRYLNYLKFVPEWFTKSFAHAILFRQNHAHDISVPKKINRVLNIFKNRDAVNASLLVSQTMTFEEEEGLFKDEIDYLKSSFDESNLINRGNDSIQRIMAVDYKTYMADDILQKVDKATMSVSLEGREPFLDQRVIEYVSQLPSSFKLHHGVSKYLLREITHDYIPKEIMERPKMGFGVPVNAWCKKELKGLLLDNVNKKSIEEQGIFNSNNVIVLVNNYLSGQKVDFPRIWNLFMFQMWYNKWMS